MLLSDCYHRLSMNQGLTCWDLRRWRKYARQMSKMGIPKPSVTPRATPTFESPLFSDTPWRSSEPVKTISCLPQLGSPADPVAALKSCVGTVGPASVLDVDNVDADCVRVMIWMLWDVSSVEDERLDVELEVDEL